jgi:hypothetical protein
MTRELSKIRSWFSLRLEERPGTFFQEWDEEDLQYK